MRCKACVLPLCLVLASSFASGQTASPPQVECWRTIAKSGTLLNCYTAYDFAYVRELSKNPAAFEAFGEILAEALRQKNPEVVRAAAYTLSHMGQVPTSARQALLGALESQDEWTRRFAARALGKFRPVECVECWRTIAKSGDLLNCYKSFDTAYLTEVSKNPAAFEAFGEILAEALRQKKPEVVRAAAYTLSQMEQVPTSARQALLAAVESQDKWTRLYVAEALGKLRPPVIEPLLRLASDQDGQVRADVAESLGGLCKAHLPAVEPLLQLAADPDPWVRSHAAEALGKCTDGRGIARLIELITDVDKYVRASAAGALKKLAPELGPPAVEALASALQHGSGDTALLAAEILGGLKPLPPVARKALLEAAGSQDAGVRRVVAWALRGAQPPEVEALLGLASDADPDVRRAAARGLAGCTDRRAASRLAELLADPEAQVRFAARDALAKLGPGAAEALLETLKRPHGQELGEVVKLLGRIEDTRVADTLVTLLEDRTTPRPVRDEAVEALQRAKAVDRQAVGRLIALLENDELSFDAAAALEKSQDERVPEAMKAYQRRRAQRLWAVIKTSHRGAFFNEFRELEGIAKIPGSGAVEILVEAVGLPNPDAAGPAALIVSNMRPLPPAARDALVAAAASPAPALRDTAALALSRLQPPPVEPLLKLASDPEPRVRRSAAEALGLCADNRGATRLTELLTDTEKDVRTTARESLAKLGPAAADALLAALNHANGPTLETILYLERHVKDPRAADRFVSLIEDDKASWGMQMDAAMALGEIRPADPRIVARLIALLAPLESPEASNRAYFAARVLGDLNSDRADDRVTDALVAYQKRRSAYEAALRNRDQGDLVTTGGFRGANLLIDECQSCTRDSDCRRGLVCRTFRAVKGGEIRRICAWQGQAMARCSQ